MSQSPGSVLAGIPGWEDASVRALHGGLTNRTWLVEAQGRKAVLKIDDAPRAAPFNSRRKEAQIQTSAAAAGLANRVLAATDVVYLTEYVDGDVWTPTEFDNDENLTQLGRALRRMHALPLTGRTFDAKQAARQYASQIENADTELLRGSLRVVDAMPSPSNLCCCHNDLVAGNIIATPQIRFLDWEYACDNDPFFDLATVVAHHDLSEDRAGYLLDAYFDGNGNRWRDRLAMYERFYVAILWLWRESGSASRDMRLPRVP
ncbi:MAG: phosphotransferase family protein [Gammaproteobacteria bacterium]|nr:phosphotransferase family protein [Gammaproteobacteria bacterium]MDH3429721.1 phosphotransferase family protein [Gammaproteobacteria bacterium]